MGLSWQQGPLAPGAVGRFLVAEPLPNRLLFAEPLRRRMRVRFGERWIADSENVILLHEPGRYPVAYFPLSDIARGLLHPTDHKTRHPDLGLTSWYTVQVGEASAERAAWEHRDLPTHADDLRGRVAFAWRAMDGFYEEDDRIVGHASDMYHRIDIRRTSRHLVVRHEGEVVADSTRPLVLYESGFAPRWYVPRSDVQITVLDPAQGQTFCPYKGVASYYDIGAADRAAWSYEDAWDEVRRISGLLSFEPDKVSVFLDGARLSLEPGQTVFPRSIDRNLSIDELDELHEPSVP
jgi:uncharacterized protein (DUF427 family)